LQSVVSRDVKPVPGPLSHSPVRLATTTSSLASVVVSGPLVALTLLPLLPVNPSMGLTESRPLYSRSRIVGGNAVNAAKFTFTLFVAAPAMFFA
jgi:hypothetical protein